MKRMFFWLFLLIVMDIIFCICDGRNSVNCLMLGIGVEWIVLLGFFRLGFKGMGNKVFVIWCFVN